MCFWLMHWLWLHHLTQAEQWFCNGFLALWLILTRFDITLQTSLLCFWLRLTLLINKSYAFFLHSETWADICLYTHTGFSSLDLLLWRFLAINLVVLSLRCCVHSSLVVFCNCGQTRFFCSKSPLSIHNVSKTKHSNFRKYLAFTKLGH